MVALPDAHAPVFPRACVVCGRAGPEPLVAFTMGDEYAMVDLCLHRLGWERTPGRVFQVPVHDSCARGIRNRWLRWLLLAVAIAAGIVAGAGVRGLDLFWASMAALVVAVLLATVPLRKPAPVEPSSGGGRVWLTFRDREYASLVARLNGAEVEQQELPPSVRPRRGRPRDA